MSSLQDIPEVLLSEDQENNFVDWLESIPMSDSDQRTLVHKWETALGVKIDRSLFSTNDNDSE